MYKLVRNRTTGEINCVNYEVNGVLYTIPFAPDNTDYQNFKKQINADEAQLEDADGNLMTDAKAYVTSLP